jgi:hypothetical protein
MKCGTFFIFVIALSFNQSITQNAQAALDDLPTYPKGVVVKTQTYTRYEVTQHATRIREFSAGNGRVFGVAWRGVTHPDLKTLLGKHYSDFQKAYALEKRNHHHGGVIAVDSGDLHIEIGGRMMSVYGQIWLKDKIPPGVGLNEIR